MNGDCSGSLFAFGQTFLSLGEVVFDPVVHQTTFPQVHKPANVLLFFKVKDSKWKEYWSVCVYILFVDLFIVVAALCQAKSEGLRNRYAIRTVETALASSLQIATDQISYVRFNLSTLNGELQSTGLSNIQLTVGCA